jgi:transglutaminase-like putative cysteine protease
MKQKYTITHKTLYTYEWEAMESYSRVKVTPIETLCQEINYHHIEVKPDVPVYSHFDFFGNFVHEFSVPFRHRSLEIVAKSEVTTYLPSREPLKSEITIGEAAKWFQSYHFDFYDYVNPSTYIPITNLVRENSRKILAPERKLTDAIMDLNHWFTTDFKYKSGSTHINTPIDEVLLKRNGVCQDFAHTMIALLRSVGIPARYVSGYIESYDPNSSFEMIGSEQSHAWLDVFIPEFSWFGLDPTNDMTSSEKHVRVALGRDFDDISPVRGTFKGSGKQYLRVDVKMRRLQTPEAYIVSKSQGQS